MIASNFMHGWMVFIGSLATIALILTVLGLMLGIVKAADAVSRVATILGAAIVLTLVPGALVSAWSGMSLWQQFVHVAFLVGVWQCLKPRRQARKK